MIDKYNYYVDYNHASDASTILWTHEDISIKDCKPYIDFIRCDFDGEDYQFLYSDENDFTFKINNFGCAISFKYFIFPARIDREFFRVSLSKILI